MFVDTRFYHHLSVHSLVYRTNDYVVHCTYLFEPVSLHRVRLLGMSFVFVYPDVVYLRFHFTLTQI